MPSIVLSAIQLSIIAAAPSPPGLQTGTWRAWLDSPGGELPFGLELTEQAGAWRAWFINGEERITVPTVTWDGSQLVLDVDHYDSIIRATPNEQGNRLDGEWVKRASGGGLTRMAFHATHGGGHRFTPKTENDPGGNDCGPFNGRWLVKFSSSDDRAIGRFACAANGIVTGTFLTTTGDYRFLAGNVNGRRMRLSAFDGAHAFLFDAAVNGDGSLAGDFWSRDTWHETWKATRDDDAILPDGFTLTRVADPSAMDRLAYPDLDGKMRTLTDPEFFGQATILEVFGSWCPNCHDATVYLTELDKKYHDRGLRIVGLAFELTGEFERDAKQVRKFARRHGATYPMLIAGLADKDAATKQFPLLDRVRSYPTMIFLDKRRQVRAVYTGFSGPATGDAHAALRRAFEELIERLLDE